MTAADIARLDVTQAASYPLFTAPDHQVWQLAAQFVDVDGTRWEWDHRAYDAVVGPELISPSYPYLHMPLLGLARYSGLHSDTSEAVAHGALIIQQHDLAEAGLQTGGSQ